MRRQQALLLATSVHGSDGQSPINGNARLRTVNAFTERDSMPWIKYSIFVKNTQTIKYERISIILLRESNLNFTTYHFYHYFSLRKIYLRLNDFFLIRKTKTFVRKRKDFCKCSNLRVCQERRPVTNGLFLCLCICLDTTIYVAPKY